MPKSSWRDTVRSRKKNCWLIEVTGSWIKRVINILTLNTMQLNCAQRYWGSGLLRAIGHKRRGCQCSRISTNFTYFSYWKMPFFETQETKTNFFYQHDSFGVTSSYAYHVFSGLSPLKLFFLRKISPLKWMPLLKHL